MNRRCNGWALLVALLTASGTSSFADAESAQKVRRIGYLSAPTRESVANGVDAFLHKLRDLCWVEGRNLEIEYRWADGNVDRLPTLAADLVQRNEQRPAVTSSVHRRPRGSSWNDTLSTPIRLTGKPIR